MWPMFPFRFHFPPLAVDASAGVDVTVFAQYGVLGVIAIILIWFAKGAHQRERDRADRLEAEVQRLHELMLERVIPAMTSASKAAEESAALILSMQRDRELSQILRQERRGTERGPERGGA